jgi:hypothetical protein
MISATHLIAPSRRHGRGFIDLLEKIDLIRFTNDDDPPNRYLRAM